MKFQTVVLALIAAILVACGGGNIAVKTPLQGQITVGSEREAQRASRALLEKIDNSQAEIERVDRQIATALGETKRAEREALQKQKAELQGIVRENLKEFLSFAPKFKAQGWELAAFDDARYFFYTNRFKDLAPTGQAPG
ncbi:MAG: hypothetical protein H7Y22_12170 [Gemmatimonadaceae bacterium]|nr:hypothetical protein [Gloeobacterales cyanobacterium ES-bin-141]